jgi:hypothetical protein
MVTRFDNISQTADSYNLDNNKVYKRWLLFENDSISIGKQPKKVTDEHFFQIKTN